MSPPIQKHLQNSEAAYAWVEAPADRPPFAPIAAKPVAFPKMIWTFISATPAAGPYVKSEPVSSRKRSTRLGIEKGHWLRPTAPHAWRDLESVESKGSVVQLDETSLWSIKKLKPGKKYLPPPTRAGIPVPRTSG